MNGWVIAGLVLLFLAIVASVALWARDKISQLEAQKAAFNEAADKAEQALHDLIVERDALQLKLDEATRPRTRGKAKMSQERGRDI